MITSKELRSKYIEFFKEKGHIEIPSASLVPENDPTVLFTTAGMHPLVPFLMGEKHPEGRRLVNVQKCVRTGDIDDVGDSTHNTFFEMLGNWSLGDYFKQESIRWSWDFLTGDKWLGIDPKRIKVTVFEGDNDAPRDEESIKIWQECFEKLGVGSEVYDKEKKNHEIARIFPLPKGDNWWGPAGITGPCGPDTEIFIDLGRSVNFEKCPNSDDCKPGCHCGRFVEIWNNVFMEYNKTADGKYHPLSQKNVDTGMGMERTLAILNNLDNVYEVDLFVPVIEKIKILKRPMKEESKSEDVKSEKIVADHIRSSVFMIADGVVPSNLDRGYILRRLIRRAIRHGRNLEMPKNFLLSLAGIIIDTYSKFYPELEDRTEKILHELKGESEKFEKTLEHGLKELNKVKQGLTGDKAFYLYETYGFPLEMIEEELDKNLIEVNKEEFRKKFNEELHKHQDLSRTASSGKFKGGLADASEETIRLHTGAHLLLESLRRVLGKHVYQKGSNITAERLRFDFAHPDKMTDEEKKKVEDLVNEQIQKKLPVSFSEMKLEDAKNMGAMGVFDSRYGQMVKVYSIGNEETGIFSKEICGGPHVENIFELGEFKIKKEESSSAGVRRIKATLQKRSTN